MAHVCSPGSWEAEVDSLEVVGGHLGQVRPQKSLIAINVCLGLT